jgi:hypothetical protein
MTFYRSLTFKAGEGSKTSDTEAKAPDQEESAVLGTKDSDQAVNSEKS